MREQSLKIFKELAEKVNEELDKRIEMKKPERFYKAIRWLPLAGGKRLRAVLPLVIGKMFGVKESEMMPFAISLEMIHNFSLVHDDIIDEDEFRRGVKTVHVAFDLPTAIIAGDTLFAMAFREISKIPREDAVVKKVLAEVSQMVIDLAEGEYEDVEFEKREDVTPEEYIEMVRKKTARIFECACYCSALISGKDEETCRKLASYGLNVGIAFQIQDDILGLIGDPKVTGKPVGSDLRKGKKTLLMIYAMQDPEKREELKKIAGRKDLSEEEVKRGIEIIVSSGAVDYCKKLARDYVEKALRSLEGMPSGPYLEFLKDLASFVVERIM